MGLVHGFGEAVSGGGGMGAAELNPGSGTVVVAAAEDGPVGVSG